MHPWPHRIVKRACTAGLAMVLAVSLFPATPGAPVALQQAHAYMSPELRQTVFVNRLMEYLNDDAKMAEALESGTLTVSYADTGERKGDEDFGLEYADEELSNWFGIALSYRAGAYVFEKKARVTHKVDPNGNKCIEYIELVVLPQALQMKEEVESAIDEVLAWVPDQASDMQKAKAVHDWLVRNCSYDLSVTVETAASKPNAFDEYGSLVQRTAVCQGYALAFATCMDRLGIECDVVTEDGKVNTNDSHIWNRVKIDGYWYNIDVTADDPVPDQGYDGAVNSACFLKSDAWFMADAKLRNLSFHNSFSAPLTAHTAINTSYDAQNTWETYPVPDTDSADTAGTQSQTDAGDDNAAGQTENAQINAPQNLSDTQNAQPAQQASGTASTAAGSGSAQESSAQEGTNGEPAIQPNATTASGTQASGSTAQQGAAQQSSAQQASQQSGTGTEESTSGAQQAAQNATDTKAAAAKASAPATLKKGSTFKVAKQKYRVIKQAGSKTAGAVSFVKAANKQKVSVPATVKHDGKTYKVTKVAAGAFKGAKIRSITLGAKVTSIASGAFKGSKATRIVTGAGLKKVTKATFKGATKLKQLTLGKSVKTLAAKAFSTNKALRTVILKTAKLSKKKAIKGCFKGSKVKTVKVKVSSKKKTNKTYVAQYKKLFTKASTGTKASKLTVK